ncbi:MAG: signal peptide peptidase SppA [Bdellovibrionales bacterium]|nr:signal peptide peptidase SppA [Bdellovibrionales bacterium]
MKRFFQFVFIAFGLFLLIGFLAGVGGIFAIFNPPEEKASKASIMALDLDGVILDGKDILELLRKHRKDTNVKGVLIRISSPGGVVGPSQELHDEIKRTREEFKKPVIAYCASVAASGAYYAAVAADKIYTTPGCMVGSIGALIEFVNLEKLYDWAKIQRYAVTTGKFKDAGAEYKPLTPEARALFQELLDDVLVQFKQAIVDGRKMKMEELDKYADGRVFTGAQAVKLGFADQVGSWDDARAALGEMAGLGKDPKVFKAKKARGFREFFEEASESKMGAVVERLTQMRLSGQPLFILPGATHF